MKNTLFLIFALLFFGQSTKATEIVDADGNLIFYTVDTGRTQEDQGLQNGQVVTTAYKMENLISKTGQVFEYDFKWEVITSDGQVFMDYNFNKRQWKWVEGKGIRPSQSAKGEAIRRTYDQEELIDPVTGNYEGEYIYTTPEQGNRPFMVYKNGQYFNEFGEVVYTLKGQFKRWWSAIVVHSYYEEFYGTIAPENLTLLRNSTEERFGNSNSIAEEMISIGHQSMRMFGGPFEMVYFVTLDGNINILTEGQVLQLKNKWLVLNEKTRRGSAPRIVPQGGFYVKKKDAKKRGMDWVSGKNFVLEIKIQPEHVFEFKSEILEK